MTSLKIAEGVSLPQNLCTQSITVLAKRRVGKSYTMRKIWEELLKSNQHVVVIDPKGDQWGIRSSADGKRPGFPVLILGGEHGDLPLEKTGGELIAHLIVEQHVNVLIDTSHFSKTARAQFMAQLLENLYRLKAQEKYRTPLCMIIDEADEIAPQKPQKDEYRMLGAIDDIVRRGGQRGLGSILITQRSASLNKNVLTQSEMLILLRTIAPQDLAAVKAWIDVHGTVEQQKVIMAELPSLPRGDAYFWSPAWPSDTGMFKRAHVLPIETFDSAKTPEVGERRVIPKNLADVDLKALEGQMAQTIEKARQEDPRALQRQISDLKGQLERQHSDTSRTVEKVTEKRVEVPVLKDAQIKRLETLFNKMLAEQVRHEGHLIILWKEISPLYQAMLNALARIGATQKASVGVSPAKPAGSTPPQRLRHNGAREHTPDAHPTDAPSGILTGPEQSVLDGIFWMSGFTMYPEQTIVATLAGYSVFSSSFIKALSHLRTKGLIEGQGKNVCLTPRGEVLVRAPSIPPSRRELHERLLYKLDGPCRKIMSALLNAEGGKMSDEYLAAAADYSPLSSSYIKAKSILRKKDLMESEGKSHAARSILFI